MAEVLSNARTLLEPSPTSADHESIASAYYLHRKLSGVGPSFFTKLLWVIGQSTAVEPVPLTLDARVWSALARIGWNSIDAAGSRRRGQRYLAYLLACEKWAAHANCSPEDIEYTLYRNP